MAVEAWQREREAAADHPVDLTIKIRHTAEPPYFPTGRVLDVHQFYREKLKRGIYKVTRLAQLPGES